MMDSNLWHAQARFNPVVPEPIDAAALSGISRRELDIRKESVLEWVSHVRLEPAAHTTLFTQMDRVVERNLRTGAGAKTILGLTAPNTVGKSTLARHWALQRYRSLLTKAQLQAEGLPSWKPTRNIEADLVPVVWLNIASKSGPKEFNAQLLHFLGHRSDGYLRSTNERVAVTIARQGVRLVIVDDVHLLRTGYKDGQIVLDHLKYINTALGEHHATLMLIGANLRGGDIVADPQIAGRLRLLDAPVFPIETEEQKHTWVALLRHAEGLLAPYLPRAAPGFLVTKAPLLWRRTQGYLGDLGELLRQASWDAVASERWAITPDDIATTILSERAHGEEARIAAKGRRKAG